MQANAITAPQSSHRTAAAFEQYVSGRRAVVEGAAFFVEQLEHLDEVLRVARQGDTVFAPVGSGGHSDQRVIGYEGAFEEPGDEMTLDGRHLFELQDYLAAPFISIVGLTVIRQGSAEGVAAFLSDADTARNSGIFVDQLLSDSVLLDSRSSFLSFAPSDESLVRVHVSSEGTYRDGPDGLALGHLGDARDQLETAARDGAGRGRGFARIMDRDTLGSDLDDRPWLERYVAALDLLRQWDGAPRHPVISGFGGHLVTALDRSDATASITSAEAPFLVTGDGEDFILIDRASRRRFRLGGDSARAAECLIATPDDAAAAAMLASEVGQRTSLAAGVVRQVRERFSDAGVDLTAYAPSAL